EELLADARSTVQEDRGDVRGTGCDGGLDDALGLTRTVGDARKDRCDQDARRDPGVVERPDGVHPSSRAGRSRLGLPPDVLVHRSVEKAAAIGATDAACSKRSMSRRISVPLVRMENGFRRAVRALRIPRIKRYRPSTRWYGSVPVPIAMCSPFHRPDASSRARTSGALIFTTIFVSKSRPASMSR